VFVERLLPASVLRQLDETTMAAYRAPFTEPGEGRRPTLTWPREIPFDGQPADVHEIIADYAAWLPQAPFPKLFIDADPGFVLTGQLREFARTWAHQSEVRVAGSHFVQEDSGPEIGAAIAAWLRSVS
jgi:haloalkane dehalogenase